MMLRSDDLPRNQWVDIGERPRYDIPLMWLTYENSPITVKEACDLAYENRLILMHRHTEEKVVASVYIPARNAMKPVKKGGKKGGKGY